jgi:aliphatic nitrilase
VLRDEEGLLYCEIDLADCVEPKQFHDVAGYYNRFDVFDLRVCRTRQVPVAFSEEARFDDAPDFAAGNAEQLLPPVV